MLLGRLGASPVELLDPGRELHLGDTIQLELSTNNAFGKHVHDGLVSNRATTISGLQLHLQGVPMVGLTAEDSAGTNEAAVLLRFTLTRNSQNPENRKAWDQLLDRLGYANNHVQVALSSGGDLAQVADAPLLFTAARPAIAIAAGISAFAVFLLLMWWAVASGMLRDAGADSAYSLGKTQMAFWGLVVALSFLAVFAVTQEMERIPGQTLILMGISGVTGLSAAIIGGSKSGGASNEAAALQEALGKLKSAQAKLVEQKKALQALKITAGLTPAQAEEFAKLTSDVDSGQEVIDAKDAALAKLKAAVGAAQSYGGRNAWLKDIVSDANGISFQRFQVCLWTLILGTVFIYRVATRITMPEFEATLLTLMGLSNGLYLGFKTQEPSG